MEQNSRTTLQQNHSTLHPLHLTIIALLCVLLLGSCQPPIQPEQQRSPLKVAIDLWPGYYPLIIAEQKGFFRKEQVKVKIIMPENTDRMVADFAANTFDAIAVALGDLINLTQSNPDINVVLISDESAGGDVLLGREPFTGIDQVRGKKIGTNLGGFGELFVRRWMEKYHIPPQSVTLVNVEASQVPDLLASGAIFGGHCWEPYVSRARNNGAVEWFSSSETPGLIPDVLAFQGTVIRERRKEVQRLVRAWFQAVDWWLAHPREGNELVERYLKVAPGSISLSGIKLMTLAMNREAFTPSDTMKSVNFVTKQYFDFFVQRGSLSRPLAPEKIINDSFLQ